MPRLFLRVLSEATPIGPDSGEGEGFDLGVEWLVKEDDGSVRGTGVTDFRGLADIADPNVEWLGNPENTIVFLPSQFVLLVKCEVPGRNIAQIRRALPFAVEEFVATDIEDMHIAYNEIKSGAPVLCNIVAHKEMQNWLACFAALNVTPGYFVADSQVLPADEGAASVLIESDMALVAANNEAASVDRGTLVFALNSLQVEKIYTINGELNDLERTQLADDPAVEAVTISEYGVLDYLACQFDQTSFVNLLQNEYKAVRPYSAQAAKWQSVGALAAVLVVVVFISMVAQGLWSEREAGRLQTESYALYKSAFPRESQPVSPDQLRKRMRKKLGNTGATNGEGSAFVGLAAQLANALDADSRVDSLSYTEQRRELTVEVLLGGYADLDVIKEKLAGAGVAVEVVSSEMEDSGARSRLRVRYDT